MTGLSDRHSDAFDNPAKMACREGNLRVLREGAFLLWNDGDRTQLRCDWCELMGATGLLTLDLLERQRVLPPGGFVGIDLDPARVDGFRQQRPDLKWVAGKAGNDSHTDARTDKSGPSIARAPGPRADRSRRTAARSHHSSARSRP